MFNAEPAWGPEQELLSSGSMASLQAPTATCQRGIPAVAIKSEACVPDYSTGCNGSPPCLLCPTPGSVTDA